MQIDLGPGAWERAGKPASAAIVDIPDNRTLIIDCLTSEQDAKPKIVQGLRNMDEVFEHYKPKVEVKFVDEEGASRPEELNFQHLGHFGKKGLIGQSDFLQNLDAQQNDYVQFARTLTSNKVLQKVLADETTRRAYIEGLKM